MGGGAVLALAAAARRRRVTAIVDAFRLAGATSPDHARPVEQLGLTDSRELTELWESGVLAQGARSGSCYLNEAAYLARRDVRSSRGMRAVAWAILALLAVLGGLLVTLVGGQQ